MRLFAKNFYLVLIAGSISISRRTMDKKTKTINQELEVINQLIRDKNFALEIAQAQEKAYFESQGQEVPDFLKDADQSVNKSIEEERIAAQLWKFTAMECGIGYLMSINGKSPYELLTKIKTDALSEDEWNILIHFANASWKASQAFIDLNKIEDQSFVVAYKMGEEETEEYKIQIKAVADFLQTKLESRQNSPTQEQLEKIQSLMQNTEFAVALANHLQSSSNLNTNQTSPDTSFQNYKSQTFTRNSLEEKVAINLAGFYALEVGISFLAMQDQMLPSEVLNAIENDNLPPSHKLLLLRLANATWKACPAFQSLDRIKKDNFIPFDLLAKDEVEKDWVQIVKASEMINHHN